jgi:asparagine synthase (glutamine-hydrolysing)
MSGIVGSEAVSDAARVEDALGTINHRGRAGRRIVRREAGTLGQVWTAAEGSFIEGEDRPRAVLDGAVHNWTKLSRGATSPLEAIANAYHERGPAFVADLDGPFALAVAGADGFFLARDPLGVAPLYRADDGPTRFASEVKALLSLGGHPVELPPGHYHHPARGTVRYFQLQTVAPADGTPEELAARVRSVLVAAIAKVLTNGEAGAWLSGGLDSSAVAALARRQTSRLHTFAVGLDGAPDLEYARVVADHTGATHHERVCTPDELLAALPEVIYHLESFDALLVRSSITNYLVGRLAAEHVPFALSGEGGDELFAGYAYLRDVPPAELQGELIDITGRLHNTALQRVDRCSRAHGLVAHVPFLDQDVVNFALSIPTYYKLNRDEGAAGKWILRRAMDGLLPAKVLERPKAEFWEGAGVEEVLSDRAEAAISDREFAEERQLPDGGTIHTKEELMYYRVFREHFGDVSASSFVGRTKGAPVHA